MISKSMVRLTTSALVVGTTMILGSVNGQARGAENMSATQSLKQATHLAAKAGKALAKKNAAKAVGFAEHAVSLQGRNADYRMLLGQAYLAAGRFQSAEQAFSDTLTLDPERERAALNLALAQTALGKTDAAQSTLSDYRDKLGAADFGLAMALAGNPQEAVRVLEYAARAPDANAKTRQNLALAFALAGNWASAKVMAVQDLSPDEADVRLATWAQFSRPGGKNLQIASVLGIKPSADGGQPTRLALIAPTAPVAVAVAQTPAPVAQPEAELKAALPAVVAVADAAPAFETPAFSTAAAVKNAPGGATEIATQGSGSTSAAPRAAPRAAREATLALSRTKVSARPAVAIKAAAFRQVKTGQYVVQIGAFQTASSAERAWTRLSGRVDLANFDAVNGAAKVGNASLVRVAIGSFANRSEADRLCARIKQTGNVCFVRIQSGDAPARWVQKHTFKVASR